MQRQGQRDPDLPLELRLEVERTDLLYNQNIPGMCALSICGAAFLIASWRTLPPLFLWVWAGCVYSSAVIRAIATVKWRKAREKIIDRQQVRQWLVLVESLLLVSGFSWGILGWIAPGIQSPMQQVVTSIVIALMAAGAVVAYAASARAMIFVFLPSMVPWAVSLALTGDPTYRLVAALLAIYIPLGVFVVRNLNRYVVGSLRLNVENSILTQNLEKEIRIKDRAREALRASQARLNLAMEASNAVTWTWKPESDEFSCEGNLPVLFGIPTRYWRSGLHDFLKFIHPDDRAEVEAKLRGLGADPRRDAETELLEHDFEIEFRVVRSGGITGDIALRGRPAAGGEHFSRQLTGISLDITEKKLRETLLREAHEAEAANRAKSVFLANVSHEIRTPLAAINGFTDMLLRQSSVGEDIRQDLQIIQRNGKYLVSLVNDLLDLSKIESGNIYIEKNRFSVIDEIREIANLMKPMVQSRGLALKVEFQTPQPEFIDADAVRFREIIINLLTNAAKFTSAGEVRLAISFGAFKDGKGILRVRISDTGIGIPPDEQKQLFQPFMRGGSETVQRMHGSGLGLALSRNLARLMDGDVHLLRSEVGKGSEFELWLRTGRQDDIKLVWPSEAPTVPVESVGDVRQKPFGGTSILVVDDSSDLQALMRRFFEYRGARVETCSNGAEAIEILKLRPFDLVLMDIKMPVMDGYAAATHLRRLRYSGPLVAVTAHASNDNRQLCYQSGFDAYISKPVDFRNLTEDLLRVLERDRHLQSGPGASRMGMEAQII